MIGFPGISISRTGALVVIVLVAMALAPTSVLSADVADGVGSSADETADHVVRQHAVRIDGAEVRYTSTTGTLPLVGENGETRARVFFMAYTRDDVTDTRGRPVTFSFNGGPGSASVWLHMGVLGPRRALLSADGYRPGPPPFELVTNEHSALDLTDLVFIDPVSTGFSRAAEGVDASEFHGFREDIVSVAEFIRLWTTRFGRWESPKYIIGESYGSRRAAGLSTWLQRRHGMDLNGLMLVSAGSIGDQYGDFGILKYALNVPHHAATAWYHGKVAPRYRDLSLREFLDEVEEFAVGDFAQALIAGNRLAPDERAAIVARLAEYTGLSESYIESAHLRITGDRFRKELLRDENRTIGRLDSRFTGIDSDAAGEEIEFDPSMEEIRGPFAATFNHYVRDELGYETDLTYEISASVRPWKPAPDLNLLLELRSAMAHNRFLRVLVFDGYYDKLYFYPAFTFSQFDFNPELRSRVTIATYEAGHMMYIHEPSLVKMKADIARFLEPTNED